MAEAREDPSSSKFPTTAWSLVNGAARGSPEQSAAALEKLCRRYWYPVYAFIRQHGHSLHAAEDLTQGFFALLLARNPFHRCDPGLGRFRSFLLTSLRHYLSNEHERATTQKRGGGQAFVRFDDHTAEQLYQQHATACEEPERRFDQHWALTLVRRVIDELRAEQEQRGNSDLFEGLRPWLTGEPQAGDQARLATRLGLTQSAVKTALHRLRRRFGELLRREVAHTVGSADDIEEELRHLITSIANETTTTGPGSPGNP